MIVIILILRIALIYLVGLMVTVLIRIVHIKITRISFDKEVGGDILKFSLFWFITWILFFLFLAMDKIRARKVKKAVKPILDN